MLWDACIAGHHYTYPQHLMGVSTASHLIPAATSCSASPLTHTYKPTPTRKPFLAPNPPHTPTPKWKPFVAATEFISIAPPSSVQSHLNVDRNRC